MSLFPKCCCMLDTPTLSTTSPSSSADHVLQTRANWLRLTVTVPEKSGLVAKKNREVFDASG